MSRPEEIILPDSTWSGVGNAWEIYSSQLRVKPALIDTDRLPTASAILSLAEAKYHAGETLTPFDAHPVYLRDDVAKKVSIRSKEG